MLLTTVESVRNPLGFDDMTDINAAIETALHSVEPQLEAQLGTRFDRVTQTDIFYVAEPGFIREPHVSTEFRLSRGFLASNPTIVCKDATNGDFTLTISPGATMVNLELGKITNIGTRFQHTTVTVTYTAGFEIDTQGDAYIAAQVPAWLREAAKLRALSLLASSPMLKDAGIELDPKVLDGQAAALINRNLRYMPVALLPI